MKKRSLRKKISTIAAAMIFSIPAVVSQLPAANQEQAGYFADTQLEQKAMSAGNVNVIVKLLVSQIKELTAASNAFCAPDPGKGSVWGGGQADMVLMDSILYAAQGVLLELRGIDYEVKYIYKSIPYMALQTSVEALAILRSLPAVLAIEEDIPQTLIEPVIDNGQPKGGKLPAGDENPDVPLLDTSATLTGASAAWSMGYTGSGRYVAILDTGIRSSHEFFGGKTIVEACYASGRDGVGPVGDCPNGLVSQIGPGTAVHYASTYQGWDHGTHVAGIATGNHGTLFGIAKDANIIAVKVFSMFTAADCGGSTPCVMSWDSDQLAGLDYVYSIRGSYNIDSVNMSLGGGAYNSACDSDSRKTAIDNLRAVGIVTAIATGNNGYCGYVGNPACISTSVAVGSTTDTDLESGFNNWHPTMQRLFAPGSTIYSSTGTSDTSYATWGGTSMATPHVAGAWALIKQAKPAASVTEILSALQTTGVAVTSGCDGYVAPISRIRIDSAINSLIPQKITVTAPNGGESWQAGTTHNITWSGSAGITNVKIEFSSDGGSQWSTIIASTPNDGSYSWDIGKVPSLNCVIRVSDVLGTASDTSDAPFVLSSPPSLTGNSFILPVSWTPAGNGTDGWYVGDFNGDGRSDLLRYVPEVSGGQVFLSSGSSFDYNGSWTGAGHGADGWYVGDYNGDGRSDLLRYVPGVSGGQVFLSDGSQFNYAGSWTGAGYGTDGWYVGDFNGDGRSDLLRYVPGVSGGQVFLSNGSSFDYSGSWTGAGNGTDGWYVGDYNGDGRSDLLRYVPGVSGGEVFLSDGTQFIYGGSWTPAGNGGNGWYLGDFNGDNRCDIMRYVLYLSGADMFLAGSASFEYDGSWTPAGKGDEDWYVGDFNGDGRSDLMRYRQGISGGEVLLSTAGSSGSALSATPLAAQAEGEKRSWLGDVPANAPLSAEEVTFVREIKARIAAGEEVSIYQIQKEYEKLTGKAHTRARIFKLLK